MLKWIRREVEAAEAYEETAKFMEVHNFSLFKRGKGTKQKI